MAGLFVSPVSQVQSDRLVAKHKETMADTMSARGNGEPRSISFVMLPSLSLVDLFVNPLGTGHIGASPITGAVPAPCRELCQFPGPRITAILRPPGIIIAIYLTTTFYFFFLPS